MMSIIDGAIQNALIDARAKQKAYMTKAKGKDKTRRQRAKEANMRDAVSPVAPKIFLNSVKTVNFGQYNPVKFLKGSPLKSILKQQNKSQPGSAVIGSSQ